MKTLKLTALLLVSLLIMNGCASNTTDEQIIECRPSSTYFYTWLYLSFQDGSGNDLVKGVGFTHHDRTSKEEAAGGVVKPHLYTLEVIFHGIMEPSWHPFLPPPSILRIRPPLSIITPRYTVVKKDYYHFRFGLFSTPVCDAGGPVPPADKISIMLTLPHVFGDNVPREIVTHWRPLPIPDIILFGQDISISMAPLLLSHRV